MSASESQSLAEPSATAKQRTISPTASVRGSSQALPGGRSGSGAARPPAGRPGSRAGSRRARRRDRARRGGRASAASSAVTATPMPGPEDRAEAEAGVEPRHDRAAEAALDLGPLDVHRDVPHAGADAVGEEADGGDRDRGQTTALPRAPTTSPTADRTAPSRTTAPALVRPIEPAGRRQGEHRARRDGEQEQPEAARCSGRDRSRRSGTRETRLAKSSPFDDERRGDRVRGRGRPSVSATSPSQACATRARTGSR